MSEAEASKTENPLLLSGNRLASLFGFVFGMFGLALVAVDRRLLWSTGNSYVFTEKFQIPFFLLGLVVAGIGMVSFLAFKWIPGTKQVAWRHLDQDALGARWLANDLLLHFGSALMPISAILLAWTYHAEPPTFMALLIVSWGSFGVSLAMLLWSTGRSGLLRRLLAFELGISGEPNAQSTAPSEAHQDAGNEAFDEEADEEMVPETAPESASPTATLGTSPAGTDPRLGIVLPALDKLLEDISEEALDSFKGTEAATLYIELLEEVS